MDLNRFMSLDEYIKIYPTIPHDLKTFKIKDYKIIAEFLDMHNVIRKFGGKCRFFGLRDSELLGVCSYKKKFNIIVIQTMFCLNKDHYKMFIELLAKKHDVTIANNTPHPNLILLKMWMNVNRVCKLPETICIDHMLPTLVQYDSITGIMFEVSNYSKNDDKRDYPNLTRLRDKYKPLNFVTEIVDDLILDNKIIRVNNRVNDLSFLLKEYLCKDLIRMVENYTFSLEDEFEVLKKSKIFDDELKDFILDNEDDTIENKLDLLTSKVTTSITPIKLKKVDKTILILLIMLGFKVELRKYLYIYCDFDRSALKSLPTTQKIFCKV